MTELNVEAALYLAAADVRRRYREYVERDDLVQEGWLWFYDHPGRVEQIRSMDKEATAQWILRMEFQRVMERFARKEKAAQCGYDEADEQFYSVNMIRELLGPALLGDTKPSKGDEGAPGTTDPAERGNFQAMLWDVSAAWEAANLTARDRAVCWEILVLGKTESELADEWGVTKQAVNQRLMRSLRKLADELGGQRPHPCGPTCECVDARLRQRPGVHGEDSGANQLAR